MGGLNVAPINGRKSSKINGFHWGYIFHPTENRNPISRCLSGFHFTLLKMGTPFHPVYNCRFIGDPYVRPPISPRDPSIHRIWIDLEASIKVVESEEVQKEAVKVWTPAGGGHEPQRMVSWDRFSIDWWFFMIFWTEFSLKAFKLVMVLVPGCVVLLHNVHWAPRTLGSMYPDAGKKLVSVRKSHRVQVKELFPDRTIFAGVGLICADMLRCGGSMLLMHDQHWFC